MREVLNVLFVQEISTDRYYVPISNGMGVQISSEKMGMFKIVTLEAHIVEDFCLFKVLFLKTDR